MDSPPFKGTSMNDIHKGQGPWKYEIPLIHPSKYHTILFEMPPDLKVPPKPHVSLQTFHWDKGYVRMPYSSKNLFPCKDKNGKDTIVPRWEVIQDALLRPILSSRHLEAAIRSYNINLPKFTALHYLFEESLNEDEAEHFFKNLLPKIINLALQLPDILPGSIPLLKMDACRSVSLSQWQIASILANCFLCTFPWKKDMLETYPGVNFSSLFSAFTSAEQDSYVVEKLKCILHYFRRVFSSAPVGVVTFERQHIRRGIIPRWDKLNNNLGNTRIHVCSAGTIEDDGLGLLQVDFANKYLGGGVLNFGCVQEEIRFVICPELIVSRLFTEKLGNLESLIITGVERFSKYSGYSNTFIWEGNYQDETPFDSSGRRQTTIVAIDAVYYPKPSDQFHTSQILRELNKAYVGYHSRHNVSLPAVATGNWGCGAFRGNVHLKFIIQLMACSAAGRDMVYYTFGDEDLRDSIYNMYTFIATNKILIYQLWQILCKFVISNLSPDKFFPFIQQAFFDIKNQPTITSFFSVNKKTEENEVEAIPSTSKNEDIIIKDEDYIAIDMTGEVELNEVETTVHITGKRKRSSSSDLLNIIGKIDGVVKKETSEDSRALDNGSFLQSIDEKAKRQAEEVSSNNEEIAVEEIIDNLEKVGRHRGGDKKKITDYFKKI